MHTPRAFLSLVAVSFLAFGTLLGCGADEPTEEPPVIIPEPDPDPDPIECSVDCAALEAPACMKSVCNDGSLPGTAGECVMVPQEDGAACDDGDLCTVGDSCREGACTAGDRLDCSEAGSGCMIGVCDPSDGTCVGSPAPDGKSCDDGDLCTSDDACVSGSCVGGGPIDCSHLDSACIAGSCDPQDGTCVAAPASEGRSCDGGDPCTVGTTCQAGICTGEPMDCSSLDSECSVGACEVRDGVGTCVATPANEDAACDGGDLCTIGSTCQEGVCAQGAPMDCSHLDGACTEGACVSGICMERPANSGDSCDDGDLCTVGDVCRSGACRGVPKYCASNSACTVGSCDPVDGSCQDQPVTNGVSCGDVDLCTLGGTCTDGACVGGTPKDCSSLNSTCAAGMCDPNDGSCIPVPANEGLSCDDGLACTDATVCMGGICAGGNSPACSMVPDGCCPASCSEFDDADCGCPGEVINGSCVYIPSTGSVANNSLAVSACQALGAGWDICPAAMACLPDTLTYLQDVGCSCSGGAATCGCGSAANIYIHVAGGRPYYMRGPNFPGCMTSATCTDSVSESCGTPLCCKAMP